MNDVIGSDGFVAWFYAIFYMKVVKACRNIVVRMFIYSIGIIIIIIGLFYFILTMPSIISIIGMFMILIGVIVFITPFGVNAEH